MKEGFEFLVNKRESIDNGGIKWNILHYIIEGKV